MRVLCCLNDRIIPVDVIYDWNIGPTFQLHAATTSWRMHANVAFPFGTTGLIP